jgi:hypothetical protein
VGSHESGPIFRPSVAARGTWQTRLGRATPSSYFRAVRRSERGIRLLVCARRHARRLNCQVRCMSGGSALWRSSGSWHGSAERRRGRDRRLDPGMGEPRYITNAWWHDSKSTPEVVGWSPARITSAGICALRPGPPRAVRANGASRTGRLKGLEVYGLPYTSTARSSSAGTLL